MSVTTELKVPVTKTDHQQRAAFYLHANGEGGEVAVVRGAERCISVTCDGSLQVEVGRRIIRTSDALEREYPSDLLLGVAIENAEAILSEEPWFSLETAGECPGDGWEPVGETDAGEDIWQYFTPYHDLTEALEQAATLCEEARQ